MKEFIEIMQSSYLESNKDKVRKFRKEKDDYDERKRKEKQRDQYRNERRKQKRNEYQ